jgi:predicted HNH restriction endonuclease
MSKEYRKANDWELSKTPLRKAQGRYGVARKCGNAKEAARLALSGIICAIAARGRGQAIDANNIDPEDLYQIKDNAVKTAIVAMQTLQLAKREMSGLLCRLETEREGVRIPAANARRAREARERAAAIGSRGPYSSICGTYRACKS